MQGPYPKQDFIPRSVATNLLQDSARSIYAACAALNLSVQQPSRGARLQADLILWESSESNGELTAEQAEQLSEHVRTGHSLLITLGRRPGESLLRLAKLLPAFTWVTQAPLSTLCTAESMHAGQWDAEMFGQSEPKGLVLPYYFDISPAPAALRGLARYERYDFVHPSLKNTIPAASDLWTKPLLNREWRVRVSGDNLSHSPILVTGTYGAGKVAVLASSAGTVDRWPKAEAFWVAVLRWLGSTAQLQHGPTIGAVPRLTVSEGNHAVRIDIENRSNAAMSLPVVVRALTWEGALLADGAGELERITDIPAGSSERVEVPLPCPSATGDQALEAQDGFHVRVGLLSPDGSAVLAEKRVMLDFRKALRVTVNTGNLYGTAYRFHAPGPDSLSIFRNRMGAEVNAYAYAPGDRVDVGVELANGLTNLAALAVVKDVLDPKNPSVMALKDGATGLKKAPLDGINAYGMWTGQAGVENCLRFTLPHVSVVAAIVLVGSATNTDGGFDHNPGAVIVEVDGKRVASSMALDRMSVDSFGKARIEFPPVRGAEILVRLPWIDQVNGRKRHLPWLGDIEIAGWDGPAPEPVKGELLLHLVDALTGERQAILHKSVSVAPFAREVVSGSTRLPQSKRTRPYRLEATVSGITAAAPVLSVVPGRTLLPLSDVKPSDAPSMGYIVTRGFRNVFSIGTGTAELHQAWGQPDDLIWAYSRQLKQIPPHARTQANRLYVTESDLRHYSTPWRSFGNGELFYDIAAEPIVANMKKMPNWKASDVAILDHSDRWDTGPDMGHLHGWQDFIDFDAALRAKGMMGLQGKTRSELAAEIHKHHEDQWQAWQLERYLHAIRRLREAFAAEHKQLVISAQGLPMVAGAPGEELALTIQGMSDDSSWGMVENSIPFTTGRQLAEMAFNPVWKMSTLLQWGYNSSSFNNWQWHSPVGTTEPSRRHYYDRAWRATVWPDGRYGSVYTYGYNTNAGAAYTMNENDWQQWWQLQEKHSLIAPESPIGAGLVMSSSRYADPHTRFTSADSFEIEDVRLLAKVFQHLHEAGISLPFAANVSALKQWTGDAPLIVVNLSAFTQEELAILESLRARGVRLTAFSSETTNLSAEANALFARPGATLLEVTAQELTLQAARQLAPRLHTLLDLPLRVPEGTSGYGFKMNGLDFIVVEDWLERGRTANVRVRASEQARAARACNLNDHANVPVRQDGKEWVLETALRSGDGALLVLEEEQ